jgi:hypothetical protein
LLLRLLLLLKGQQGLPLGAQACAAAATRDLPPVEPRAQLPGVRRAAQRRRRCRRSERARDGQRRAAAG